MTLSRFAMEAMLVLRGGKIEEPRAVLALGVPELSLILGERTARGVSGGRGARSAE